ncbi:hypothetical protein QCE80_17295, partial [Staphylococcus aureus]|nr:hypothetical protein [Staphylococcus aureus]
LFLKERWAFFCMYLKVSSEKIKYNPRLHVYSVRTKVHEIGPAYFERFVVGNFSANRYLRYASPLLLSQSLIVPGPCTRPLSP